MTTLFYTESSPISNSSGNVAASAATATLTSASGRTVYITGFTVTGAGATAASVIAVTVTGVIGGTQTYNLAVPAGATVAVPQMTVNFPLPLAASSTNVNIVVSAASFGAGNTNAAVVAYGYIK